MKDKNPISFTLKNCIHYTFHPEKYRFSYIKNIVDYHNWQGEKKIIYYEDLINSPKIELLFLLNFLNISNKHLNTFMKNYDKHKEKSIKAYKAENLSITEGKNIIHHSENLSKEDRIYWQKELEKKLKPEIYGFLKRYED
jgi:hypothetical protein